MFRCFDCGGDNGFLIRGSCEWCEPELHREHRERIDAYRTTAKIYTRETGQEPLSDWHAFEVWCEAKA